MSQGTGNREGRGGGGGGRGGRGGRLAPGPLERQSYDQAASDAENRTLEYDPSVRAQYIRQMLHDIPPMIERGATEEEIKAATGDFASNYPNFFKKLMDKEDLQPIHTMVNMLDRMGSGQISQHQASIVVGTQLYQKYIEPSLRRNGGGSGNGSGPV